MTKTYEGMLLLDNREVKRGWQALKDNVTGLFTKHDAEILSARRWDERRLAYPIKRQQRAVISETMKAATGSAGLCQGCENNEKVIRGLLAARKISFSGPALHDHEAHE